MNKRRIDNYKIIGFSSFLFLAVFAFSVFFFVYKAFSTSFSQDNITTKALQKPVLEDEELIKAAEIAKEWQKRRQSSPSANQNKPPRQEELKLRILNGTKTEGLGSLAADILREAGFADIQDIDNADRADYERTVFKTKKSALLYLDRAVLALGLNPNEIIKENLPIDEKSDIVIIIGQDLPSSR